MNTYKNIIIDCLNNDKVIPPRIRLNIYDKILKRIIDDENNETKYICIELRKVLNDYNINIYIIQSFILCKIELLLLNL